MLFVSMGAFFVQCCNAQTGAQLVGKVWYTIDDSTKKAYFFQTIETQGCPANIYVHDTMWQIAGGFTTVQPTFPIVPQYVFITDTLYVPVSQPSLTTIFTTQTLPTTSESDGQPITVGVKFRSAVTAFAKGIRFYKTDTLTGKNHIGYLYNLQGVLLDSGVFQNETSTGWQTLTLTKNIQLTANTTYIAAYYSPTGQYSSTNNAFNTSITNGIITGLASGTVGVNGVYSYGRKFPTVTYQNSNYWVDLVASQTK